MASEGARHNSYSSHATRSLLVFWTIRTRLIQNFFSHYFCIDYPIKKKLNKWQEPERIWEGFCNTWGQKTFDKFWLLRLWKTCHQNKAKENKWCERFGMAMTVSARGRTRHGKKKRRKKGKKVLFAFEKCTGYEKAQQINDSTFPNRRPISEEIPFPVRPRVTPSLNQTLESVLESKYKANRNDRKCFSLTNVLSFQPWILIFNPSSSAAFHLNLRYFRFRFQQRRTARKV